MISFFHAGVVTAGNLQGKDFRKSCWCKEEIEEVKSGGRHFFGVLTCGGFYMGRLVKERKTCQHDKGPSINDVKH